MNPVKQQGFTLLELLITLVVLSCLAALAIPGFFSRPEVTLENAATLLAQDLRLAQNRSAYRSEPCRFEFLESGEGYRVVGGDGHVVEHPATLQPFLRRYPEDAVFRGVRVIDLVASEGRVLSYDARGRAMGDLRVTLSFEGDLRIVRVRAPSGTIDILGSTSGWSDESDADA